MTGVLSFAGSAHADPQQSISDVKSQVTALQHDAEKATDSYNGVQEKITALQKDANGTQGRITAEQNAMNELRDQVGEIAAAQYRSGGLPTELQLLLNADPSAFLQKAQIVDQVDGQQADRLRQIAAQARMLQQDKDEASRQLAELEQLRGQLNDAKTQVQDKLNKAQQLLNKLTAQQRAAVLAEEKEKDEAAAAAANDSSSSSSSDEDLPKVPASQRAAAALAFARQQLGKPYIWGGTGPSGYDCSGLTQAAWGAAGVQLNRTTWEQVKEGSPVSKSDLQPGDLVFFYDDISHVGLYIGNGMILHAPHPGANIRTEKMSVMPFYSARRPG